MMAMTETVTLEAINKVRMIEMTTTMKVVTRDGYADRLRQTQRTVHHCVYQRSSKAINLAPLIKMQQALQNRVKTRILKISSVDCKYKHSTISN